MDDPSAHRLHLLDVLVGEWATESTHRLMPSTMVHGHTVFEWLEGKKFLIMRSHYDHPDFPDALSVIGDTGGLRMHYFDTRGVHRLLEVSITEETVEFSLDVPGWAQSFRGVFEDGGDRIAGLWKLSQDNTTPVEDVKITYRRKVA